MRVRDLAMLLAQVDETADLVLDVGLADGGRLTVPLAALVNGGHGRIVLRDRPL